jgi:hypothetical protein
MVEDGQEVSVAVRHYELLQKIADVSAIRELSPGERLTFYGRTHRRHGIVGGSLFLGA